jgi:sialate O-acetylesterase
MVVSIDTGDSLDVHPTDKKPIGERLSLLALAKTYQLPLDYSGPIFKEYQQKGNQLN